MHPKSEIIQGYSRNSQVGQKRTNVLCSDGKYRTFTATREADTFFTLPGKVSVKGKTVSGFVWHDSLAFDNENPDGVWKFTASRPRKNAELLPEWKKECTWCHKEIPLGEEVPLFIGSWQYHHRYCTFEDMFADVLPICDICGEPEDQEMNGKEYNWNGETGNHQSCERNVEWRNKNVHS